MEIFCFRLIVSVCMNDVSRMRNSLSITSVSVQKKLCKSCTHSKYETITPPALHRMSGIMKISGRWSRIASASGVVGPFAASARMRH